MLTNKSFFCLMLFFVAFSFVSCHNLSGTSKSSSIKGVDPVIFIVQDTSIWRKNGIVPDFYYLDSLGYGQPVLINKAETKLLITAPVFLLHANRLQTPYYIYPGEHIIINKDSGNDIAFFIQGDSIRSNELMLTKELIKNTGILYGSAFQASEVKKAESMAELAKEDGDIAFKKVKRISFADTFSKFNKISPAFKKLTYSLINNAAIIEKLFLLRTNRYLPNGQIFLRQNMQSCINELNNEDSSLFTYMYYYALSNAVSINATSFIENEIFDSSDFTKKFDFINQKFNGAAKLFLLSNIIAQAIQNQISVSKANMQDYFLHCSDSTYMALIKDKVRQQGQRNYPKGSSKLLSADGKTVQDIQDVLKKCNGRLVLLDFWASWCSPCRAEMPWSVKLKQAYAGNDITFIYITEDDNVKNWQNATIEEGLGAANNYFLLNSKTASFVSQNKIQSIPRYILIGKDGKIINNDAPRPSDPKLKEMIDKNL